ncbi:MAG: S8 family serine peptidase, partial [Acidobacteria bacterium]|nr:S8 family serine peptidase [Acidobacteriota bacterium]
MKQLLSVFLLVASLAVAQVVPNSYVVELEGAPALEGFRAGRLRTDRASFEAARVRIRDEQESSIRALRNAGGTLRQQLDTVVNGIVVEMPDAEASKLRQLPGVKNVYPVYVAKRHLDRALELLGVPIAWNYLPGGPDSAGAGIKVAVVDTGVDVLHPGFRDDTLPPLDGYPKYAISNEQRDKQLTNSKVIVMRSYENLISGSSSLLRTASDGEGHGTGVAFAAVGHRMEGPFGPISGVAPSAYLGVYRLTASSGSTTTAAILAALDDAVKDGMDVINLSFGSVLAPDYLNASALQRIADAGVVLVSSMANQGPGYQSGGWPASSEFVVAVGATSNNRTIGKTGQVKVDDRSFVATNASNSVGRGNFSGPLVDAASLNDPLGCGDFPGGSMKGAIALILRGTCAFSDKLDHAKAAGAIAAIIYNPTPSDTAVSMTQGTNTLPAVWVNYSEGLAIKAKRAEWDGYTFSVNTTPDRTPDALSSFSSMGPSPGSLNIKPDLVAVGDNLITASPISCCADWASTAGYALSPTFGSIQGTSFSSPIVAGAVAVLKQSRPGLTQQNYKSLIVNSSAAMRLTPLDNRLAYPFEAGAGRMNLDAAVRSTAAVWPVSLSFGGGTKNPGDRKRTLAVTNVSDDAETFTIKASPISGVTPQLSQDTLTLGGKSTTSITVSISGEELAAGSHHGFLLLKGTRNEIELRIPYWYGVASNEVGSIALLVEAAYPAVGSSRQSIYFRITDTSGQGLNDAAPDIAVETSGGLVDSITASPDGGGLY